MSIVVSTDEKGSVILPGYPSCRFYLYEQSDGSIVLEPIVHDLETAEVFDAQVQYDNDPELQAILMAASKSPTLIRSRPRRS